MSIECFCSFRNVILFFDRIISSCQRIGDQTLVFDITEDDDQEHHEHQADHQIVRFFPAGIRTCKADEGKHGKQHGDETVETHTRPLNSGGCVRNISQVQRIHQESDHQHDHRDGFRFPLQGNNAFTNKFAESRSFRIVHFILSLQMAFCVSTSKKCL